MTATLYTPQLLALATSLAAYPWEDTKLLQATARSKSCGSIVSLGLTIDDTGCIAQIGIKAQACAVGQAAAGIFAASAIGCNADRIAAVHQALALWLTDQGPIPDWPGLTPLDPARAYPARHGAILLAWQAAREALSSGDNPR